MQLPCRLIAATAALAAAAVVVIPASGARTPRTAKVVFVDVGQGDGVVMRIGSAIIVSDAGQLKSENVDAALRALGATQIDVAILSHPHADHITDFLTLFDEWKVKKAVLSSSAYWQGNPVNKAVMESIGKEGLKPTYVHAGQRFRWGGASWLILNPEEGQFTGGANQAADSSVAYLLRVNGVSLLFTGDIDVALSKGLAELLPPLDGRLDVFLVTHHGSRFASPSKLLDLIRPRYAVLSVGPNVFHHPTEQTIERLEAAGSTIWCTDVNGTVTLTISRSGSLAWDASGQKLPWWSAKTQEKTGSCVGR